MKEKINLDLYHCICAITSYKELMIKLVIFNISGYDDLTEREFNTYYSDDWKWHQFCCCIAGGYVLPF